MSVRGPWTKASLSFDTRGDLAVGHDHASLEPETEARPWLHVPLAWVRLRERRPS